MCLQFVFVIFWQKDLGTKAAHKMLVKLTPERITRVCQICVAKSGVCSLPFLTGCFTGKIHRQNEQDFGPEKKFEVCLLWPWR